MISRVVFALLNTRNSVDILGIYLGAVSFSLSTTKHNWVDIVPHAFTLWAFLNLNFILHARILNL